MQTCTSNHFYKHLFLFEDYSPTDFESNVVNLSDLTHSLSLRHSIQRPTRDFAISRTRETVSRNFLPFLTLGKPSQEIFYHFSHSGNRLCGDNWMNTVNLSDLTLLEEPNEDFGSTCSRRRQYTFLKLTTFDFESVGEFESVLISGKGSGNHKRTG